MSTFIILGDPHIGKGTVIGKVGLGTILNSRIVDQSNLLDWTLEQAINSGANNIIITGDVFEDPKPHPSLITLFISWLKKCEISNVHVHILRGNHDILRTGNYYVSPLDIVSECELDNVSVYKEIDTIFFDDVAFTFIPFRDRKSYLVNSNAEALGLLTDSLVYELASIPSHFTKVLVGHLAIEGAIFVGDEVDDMANELFCPVKMFTGYDYVWMGHVHKPQVLSKFPYVAHIGSMDISDFGESDHTKILVKFDIEEKHKFSHINLPTRKLKKLTVSIPKDTKDTTQYVLDIIEKENNLDNAIVRLEVHLTSPELLPINRSSIEKSLYAEGAFNISGISESKKLSPLKKDNAIIIDTTIDVPSAIKAFAEAQIDKDKRDAFIELAIDIHNQLKNENQE